MKIVRSPLVRSVAIVTVICAIAAGNLATSSGGCAFRSCWARTTWYRGAPMKYFAKYPANVARDAWNVACSGKVIAPTNVCFCGCILCSGIVCPCHLCCDTVPCSVGTTSIGSTLAFSNRCKVLP
jgi:hypothetical protein